ncbi:MAG: paraquat-inducible protein A [Gemmatimonadota bacterium]|nr:paraquat-inducible protein A [Gemmatimonadota bacterium]
MTDTNPGRRWLAVAGLAVSVAILIPGLTAPVITVRGTLDPQGVATLGPQLLEQGLSDEVVDGIRLMLNPALVPLLEMSPGGLKGALVNQLGGQLAQQLADGAEIEVYRQTRSILGSVQHLYRVGSGIAATLILLFSVVVPFTKAALVMWAVLHRHRERRRRTLHFVELIAKWSMADVFAMALLIAYLAARASQTPPGPGYIPQPVQFAATLQAGFYWFAAYCLVSLGTQQATARWIMADQG